MAKKQQATGTGKSRIRVVAIEIEADDDTLQNGFAAIAASIQKAFATPDKPVVQRLLDQPSKRSAEISTDEETLDVEDDDTAEEPTVPKVRVETGKARTPPKLKIDPQLNLCPEGREAFTDFYARHKHDTQFEQIAIAVFYLETILELGGITAESIYTCFEAANEKVPNDLKQIIRNACSANKAWIQKANGKTYEMTMFGINHVKQSLVLSQEANS